MSYQKPRSIEDALSKTGFSAGGQSYAAHIMGGIIVDASAKTYEDVFAHGVNDATPANVKMITNQVNAGKLGNTEAFAAKMVGFRFPKLTTGDTKVVKQALVLFLQSLRFEFFIGDNKTRVLDIQLSHFANTINVVSDDATSAQVAQNPTAWLTLPEPMWLGPNDNYSAKLSCGLDAGTPTGLGTSAAQIYVVQALLAGIRYTK